MNYANGEKQKEDKPSKEAFGKLPKLNGIMWVLWPGIAFILKQESFNNAKVEMKK